MCLVFGKRRQEFEEAVEVARRLLASDNLDEMQLVAAHARYAWTLANVGESPSLEVVVLLEARVETLRQQQVAQALHPCASCRGRVFRISKERDIEPLGKVRFVVCAGCGVATTHVSRLDALTDQFGPPLEAPAAHAGPFR
jgi:hypothetical protein